VVRYSLVGAGLKPAQWEKSRQTIPYTLTIIKIIEVLFFVLEEHLGAS
jgi:hypothetical protein